MAKYRKKPVVIEAWQFTRDNYYRGGVPTFIKQSKGILLFGNSAPLKGSIHTLEGVLNISENDYIIKGVKGEFYPCKPDIFESTYAIVGGCYDGN